MMSMMMMVMINGEEGLEKEGSFYVPGNFRYFKYFISFYSHYNLVR